MMKRIYTFALLAALMLAGCEREEQRSDSPKRMVIDPTMVGMPLPTSRATETDFEQGDAIGLSVTTSGGERYASNARFLFDASQGRFLSADGLLWYEDVNATSTLFACYPYREGDALPASFTVAEDQNGGGYAASDLMTALKSDVRPTASAVGMTFRHRMARLIVNVDNRSGSPVDGIVVRNAVGRGLLDAADDTFRVDPDGAAVAVKARELTADAKYYVLLVPQSVRLEVEVTTAEGPRTYTLGEAELQGGKNHTLNVRILPAEMEVVLEDEITGWEDGDELFPEESLPGGDDGEQEGWLEYGGERYRTATLADGRTWMAENLRYVPQGRSVSSDPSDGSGIWYPCDLNRTASPGLVAQNGLLYSYPVLLGLDGPLSAENYNRSEAPAASAPRGGTSRRWPSGCAWRVPAADSFRTLNRPTSTSRRPVRRSMRSTPTASTCRTAVPSTPPRSRPRPPTWPAPRRPTRRSSAWATSPARRATSSFTTRPTTPRAG